MRCFIVASSLSATLVLGQSQEDVSATLSYVSIPNQVSSQTVTISNPHGYALAQNYSDSLSQSNGTISFQFPAGIRELGSATGTGSCYTSGTVTQNETESAAFTYTY